MNQCVNIYMNEAMLEKMYENNCTNMNDLCEPFYENYFDNTCDTIDNFYDNDSLYYPQNIYEKPHCDYGKYLSEILKTKLQQLADEFANQIINDKQTSIEFHFNDDVVVFNYNKPHPYYSDDELCKISHCLNKDWSKALFHKSLFNKHITKIVTTTHK